MTRTKRSPEQRKAEAEALHQKLTDQVEALTTSGEWRKFLAFCASFHGYSLNNLLLILCQRPEASQVAGFRQWQAKGRQVRKGEKAIKIRGYSTKKVTEEDENGDEVEKQLARFPILSVFDIDQTDPIEGAEQIEHPAKRLQGDDETGILEAVTKYLTSIGWSVGFENIGGETNGYTRTDGSRRVVIDAGLSPAQAAKTGLHEAGHVILHSDDKVGEYVAHRGMKETEAESVAYVAAGMLGMDTSAYSVGYVTGWAGGDLDLIKSTAQNVMRAVHILAGILTPDEAAQAA